MIGNIRNIDDFINNLIPWDKLNGAFPRGIRPTDIDGFTEVNNRFLFLEAKNSNSDLTRGQRWAFERLSRVSPAITFIVFHWEPTTNEVGEFYEILAPDVILGTGWDELYSYCKRWAE